MITGFIVTGDASKRVLLRALGPSLENAGIMGALDDPIVELRDGNNALLAYNDNWETS